MRRLARFTPILALALSLSCADMPTAPRPRVTISGQITDRDGPGIEGAYVSFFSLDPRDQPQETIVIVGAARARSSHDFTTVTDGSGRYRLTLPAGPYEVFLSPSGYPYATLPRVQVAQGSEVNYRYDGVRISGDVTGPAGVALTNVDVWVYRYEPYSDPVSAYSRISSGRYSFLVPPGTYALRAQTAGGVGLPRVEIPSLAIVRDTTVDLSLDGHAVTGTVTGQNGAPLDRILIRASNTTASSEVTTFSKADGSYTMYLPTGVYHLRLSPWDLSYIASREFAPVSITGPATLDFDMSGVEWTGTVKRSSDSTAISASVGAFEVMGVSSAYATTDGSGAFRLIVAPNTYYTLRVSNSYLVTVVGVFATAADSTFDLYVDAPPLP